MWMCSCVICRAAIACIWRAASRSIWSSTIVLWSATTRFSVRSMSENRMMTDSSILSTHHRRHLDKLQHLRQTVCQLSNLSIVIRFDACKWTAQPKSTVWAHPVFSSSLVFFITQLGAWSREGSAVSYPVGLWMCWFRCISNGKGPSWWHFRRAVINSKKRPFLTVFKHEICGDFLTAKS